MPALVISGATAQQGWFGVDVRPGASRDAAIAYDESRAVTILFGGEGEIVRFRDETWEWNGERWRQRFPARYPSLRSGHAMCYDSTRDKIVLFGGYGGTPSGNLADTWEWDGATWTQITTTTAPSPRYGHGMVFDTARQRTVLYGGFAGGGFAGDTWLWDGVAWTQAATPLAPKGRPRCSMAFDSWRNRVVLFGGWGSPGWNDTWEWDGTQWLARTPSVAPSARFQAPMAFDKVRRKMVMAGGAGATDTWEWDGSIWEKKSPAQSAESTLGSAVYDAVRAEILVYGYLSVNSAKSQMAYDGNDWRLCAPPHPSFRGSASLAPDTLGGGMLLFGGTTGGAETWRLRSRTWSLLASGPGPSDRYGHACAQDPSSGRILLFGGAFRSGLSGVVNQETWQWDGSQWLLLAPGTKPSSRVWAASAHDHGRGKTWLFGGATETLNLTPAADTWAWDGSTWTKTSAVGPSARYGAAMAHDRVSGKTFLFGGAIGTSATQTYYSDTWSFDGAAWTRLNPALAPTPRGHASLCYDEVHRRLRLFGGQSRVGLDTVYHGDTWEWTGSSWLPLPVIAPAPPRSQAAMAFDPATGSIVLYGGRGGTYDDTWELRGAVPPRSEPFGRGCGGTYGVLALTAKPKSWPVLGARFSLEVAGVRPAWPAFLTLGASRSTFGGLQLPFDLGVAGMPGCTLLASGEVALFALADLSRLVKIELAIPGDPLLLGNPLYLQAFTPDLLANALGWTSSNALMMQIGE